MVGDSRLVGPLDIEFYIKRKMKNNNELNVVGDNKISKYQKSIIIIGVLLILLFLSLSIIYKSIEFLYAVGFIIALFSLLILFYSKVFSIQYDEQYFYIQNIFVADKINVSEFKLIKSVKFVDFLFKIKFNHKSFLFLITSDDFFKNVFRSKKLQAKEIEQKIIKDLKTNHNFNDSKKQTD